MPRIRVPSTQDGEARWPASLAVVVTMLLYISLPERLIPGPKWIVPALEAVLLLPLTVRAPHRHKDETAATRYASMGMVAIINVANLLSLIALVRLLLGGHQAAGRELIMAAVQIWLTNVVIFALWYWELDQGGPGARRRDQRRHPDFLFPQLTSPDLAKKGWRPQFLDYLYTSLTNATAFSPTDTLPLSLPAKSLMAVQSLASLITVALVAARAVNILS